MRQEKVIVKLKTGLQARPAALFVQEANRYTADIYIEKDNKKVNAKSIMGIMSLAIASGKEVVLSVKGQDAEAALTHLSAFLSREE